MNAVWRHRSIVLGVPLGLLLLALIPPSDDGPTVCPFALCTGTACPGCGMSRALSSLLRGDFSQAFAYHPLVMVIVVQGGIAWAWYMLQRAGRVAPPRRGLVSAALIVTAVALLGLWLIRMTNGTLPPV